MTAFSLQTLSSVGLQETVERAFGDRRGALVAIEPSTGAILAFVSRPGYDPNLFVDGIDPTSWDALNTSIDRPLNNRALTGVYPPGSTFKPTVGLAALAAGIDPMPGKHSNTNVPNKLVIHLQPKDGLELHLFAQGQSKRGQSAGGQTLSPVHLDLDFDKRFGSERVGAYERLLLDVLDGRLNLFVRSDEQEQAWRWVEPILDAWSRDTTGLRTYAAGSWGPAAASALVARDGFAWAEEQ